MQHSLVLDIPGSNISLSWKSGLVWFTLFF
uniref:Uncharacterized protein n=1 Tax=Anguilla anguilla TaxID=7936 RepID=A0A0E9SU43_ANGAN